MKLYYLLTFIVFITALILGIKKGKKSGYTVFAFLGVIVSLFTFNLCDGITLALTAKGMGKPELLGQNLGSFLAIALSTSIALGVFSILFMIIKYNKKDLVPEVCCIVGSAIIAISSFQLVGTLANLEHEDSYPSVSMPNAKQAVTIK